MRTRPFRRRSEEHTSELQSLAYLVCRLLLEKQTSRRLPGDPRGASRPADRPLPRIVLAHAHARREPRVFLAAVSISVCSVSLIFFLNDPAPTELSPLSLPAPLPI